jgi:hypothetical protein
MAMTLPRIAMLMVLGAWVGCTDTENGGVMSISAPAGQLDVELTFDDSDPAPADAMVPVTLKVFHGQDYVRLSSATMTVDDVVVPYSNTGYMVRIPQVPSGGTITFKMVESGTTTQFTYVVPQRPVILMPMTNEIVPRSVSVPITYVSAAGQGVRALAADTGINTKTGTEQSDTGMTSIDATALQPGAGSIRVARRYVVTPHTGFQGATLTYTITSPPTVVSWQ